MIAKYRWPIKVEQKVREGTISTYACRLISRYNSIIFSILESNDIYSKVCQSNSKDEDIKLKKESQRAVRNVLSLSFANRL